MGQPATALHDAVIPFRQGDDIGLGLDANSGDRMNLAVTGQLSTPTGAGGSTTTFEVTRIITNQDLEQQLGIDADASYGIASFGAGISARFDFAQRQKVQSNSLFMVVRAEVDLPSQSIDQPQLTAAAAAVIDNPTVFATRYGNMFIRSLGRGGLFIGVIRIDVDSSEESTSVAAELSGSYGLFSADASSKFSSIQSQYKASIYLEEYSEGGSINLQINNPQDPGELLANVTSFLQGFQNNPDQVAVPYSVSLAPLSIANGPLPPNIADIKHAQDVIQDCARRRSATLDSLNLVEYIADNSSKYDFTHSASLDSIRTAIIGFQSDLDVIAKCASQAMNHPETAQLAASYAKDQHLTYPTLLPDPLPGRLVGQVTVPDFVHVSSGDPRTDDGLLFYAQPLAASVGLILNVVKKDPDEEISTPLIVSQSPAAGTQVERGSTVTVAIVDD